MFRSVFNALFWPVWALGLAQTASNVGAAASFWLSGRLIRRFKEINLLLAGELYGRAANLIALLLPTVVSPAIITTSSVCLASAASRRTASSRKNSSDAQRATMASLNSLAGNLFFGVFAIGLGVAADVWGPIHALIVAELLMLLVTAIYLRLYFRHHNHDHLLLFTNGPYGCFSNFSPHGVNLQRQWWPTSEHFYQAQKHAGTPYEAEIRRAPTPKRAAEMGRDRSHALRADWEQVKDDVMREAVRTKFQTHADIRQILLDTADEEIVEASPIDYYWGAGADGSGQNRLGKILMEVRAELARAQMTCVINLCGGEGYPMRDIRVDDISGRLDYFIDIL